MKVLYTLLQVAMVTSSVLALKPVLAQEQVAAPIFQDGETWRYKIIDKGFAGPSSVATRTYELTYVNGDFHAYVFGEKRKRRVDNDARDNLLALVGKAEAEARKSYLKFPLFVGAEWRIEYVIKFRARNLLIQGRASVTEMEDVSTSAGKFRTFKIERQDNGVVGLGAGDLWRWSYVSTYYYSPEIRSIVKFHRETPGDTQLVVRDVELIGFSRNSGSNEGDIVTEDRGSQENRHKRERRN